MKDLGPYIQQGMQQWEIIRSTPAEPNIQFDPPKTATKKGVINRHSFVKQENIAVTLHGTEFGLEMKRQHRSMFHWHDHFEFNYCYHGRVVNHIDGSLVEQKEGSLLLMNPYVIHDIEVFHKSDVLWNIVISRHWVDQYFLQLFPESTSIYKFFFDAIYGINHAAMYLLFQPNQITKNLVHEIISTYFEQDIFYQQIITSRMTDLMIELMREYHQNHQKENQKLIEHNNISSILSYIRNNYSGVSLQSIAKQFGYSQNYLSRMIKQQTGKTFVELLQQIRLDYAADYLTKTNLTLDKISEMIGYNDASYLNKIFQKKFGISPHQYRIKNRIDRLKK